MTELFPLDSKVFTTRLMARLGWWPGKEFALSVQTEIGDIRGKGLEWCYLSGVAWPPFPRNEITQILLDGNWPRSSRKFEEIAFGWGSSVLHNATRYVGAHGQATITPMAKAAVDHTITLNIRRDKEKYAIKLSSSVRQRSITLPPWSSKVHFPSCLESASSLGSRFDFLLNGAIGQKRRNNIQLGHKWSIL